MSSVRLAFASALVAFAVAGCSSWNPLVALGIRSAPANPPTPLAPITASVTPRAVWTAQAGKSLGFAFRPGSQGGRIYVAAGDGALTILDEDSGRVITRIDSRSAMARSSRAR